MPPSSATHIAISVTLSPVPSLSKDRTGDDIERAARADALVLIKTIVKSAERIRTIQRLGLWLGAITLRMLSLTKFRQLEGWSSALSKASA